MTSKQNAIRIKMKAWPERYRDDWEECAAIREYDGGESREIAEVEAYAEISVRVMEQR